MRRKLCDGRRPIVVLLLLLLIVSRLAGGEDKQSSSSEPASHGEITRLCSATLVEVTDIQLTCDSPGAYYYGSGSYRKSERCKYGDKADLFVFLNISNDFSETGVDVSVDMGLYGVFTNVVQNVDLCSTGRIKRTVQDASYSCPSPGSYRYYLSFNFPSGSQDPELLFVPDVRVGFYSHADESEQLGCAVTGTLAYNTRIDRHTRNGAVALGLAMVVFVLCFGCLLYLTYRLKKRLEREVAERRRHTESRDAPLVPFEQPRNMPPTVPNI